MKVYYNEIDPFCCRWLKELMSKNVIPKGEIDDRSIEDVKPCEVKGFTQCHFFAGIGGWAYALQQARWPNEQPIWTGSCPCQPFSQAGKREGTFDERHLWPSFFWLISQCKPNLVIGEQVASSDALAWWDIVQEDLESQGYACWVSDTPACGYGAPHIRQRLYWGAGNTCWLGNSNSERLQRWLTKGRDLEENKNRLIRPSVLHNSSHPTNGFWSNTDWLWCRDKKWRPIESGVSPLVDGLPKRMVRGSYNNNIRERIKGYGNAIVAPQASIFISIIMDIFDL